MSWAASSDIICMMGDSTSQVPSCWLLCQSNKGISSILFHLDVIYLECVGLCGSRLMQEPVMLDTKSWDQLIFAVFCNIQPCYVMALRSLSSFHHCVLLSKLHSHQLSFRDRWDKWHEQSLLRSLVELELTLYPPELPTEIGHVSYLNGQGKWTDESEPSSAIQRWWNGDEIKVPLRNKGRTWNFQAITASEGAPEIETFSILHPTVQ